MEKGPRRFTRRGPISGVGRPSAPGQDVDVRVGLSAEDVVAVLMFVSWSGCLARGMATMKERLSCAESTQTKCPPMGLKAFTRVGSAVRVGVGQAW